MERIDIDPDIRIAETLPGRCYTDQRFFEFARRSVFPRSWQVIADVEQARTPGTAHPLTLLESFVDEPLVLTRDERDALHCLSNVCTHRANLVVSSPARCTSLRCLYHGRRFDLAGKFRSMPEFEETQNFPTERDNLRKVDHAQFGPLVFASLDPAYAFAELIEPVRARIGWMPLDEFRFDPVRSRDYLVRANWALYCDNYLEGFHIPFVHDSLNAVLDYGQYETECYQQANLQLGVSVGGEEVFDLARESPDFGKPVGAYYYFLFPNTMLNFYPWGLSLNVVHPLAPDRTKVSFRTYVWRPDRLDRGAGADLDRVEREDEAVVELCHRGARSRFYERGRYSPTRERCVHHFHQLLAQAFNHAMDGSSHGSCTD